MAVTTYAVQNLTNGNLLLTSLGITIPKGSSTTILTITPELSALQAQGSIAIASSIDNNAAFLGVISMPTDGVVYSAGRSIQAICSSAGNVLLTMSDGSTNTVPLNVGVNILPFAVISWTLSGVSGGATATYSNLK